MTEEEKTPPRRLAASLPPHRLPAKPYSSRKKIAATGVVAIFFLEEYDLALTALSFGVYHIVFGAWALLQRDR